MEEQFFFDREKFFKDLNPEQQAAVNCLEGPLLVMAGAGSGKTRVLTYRIANLIAQGISPWNILAITFTNKAANEMKTRAEKLIGAPAKKVVLSTFHSFCARLLRREIKVTEKFNSNFAIYDAGDSKALVTTCVNDLKLDEKVFDTVQGRISKLKNNLITVEQFKEYALGEGNFYEASTAQIYELYQKKLQQNNALDFDDLLFKTVQLFQNYPEILEKYQERFKYILIDEYQDTNVAQYVIAKQLAEKYKNICVVGDADQSIYGWRGADMRNILNFEEDYPEAQIVILEENYRSTKTILEAANSVIQNNSDRKPKNLWTKNKTGDKLKFFACRTDRIEAAAVTREIQKLTTQENFSYNDIAVLYRTNAQSRLFEEQLMHMEIPYIIIGGLKFYDRKEIKDILAYLHLINNPHDDLHLLRIINTPRRGLGTINVNRLVEAAAAQGISIMELITDKRALAGFPFHPRFRAGLQDFAAMIMSFIESAKTLSVTELLEVVIEDSGYMQMLQEAIDDGKEENISRQENLGAFLNVAEEFLEENPEGTLEDFLNHVALITDLDTVEDNESRVRLMTIHAAKGLEFPVVFVVGMEEGLFPHYAALEDKSELEEERRACYVAITRAMKKVYITAAYKRMFFGRYRDQKISRFIEEIPKNCIESVGSKYQTPQQIVAPPPQQITYRAPTAYRSAQMKQAENNNVAPVSFEVGDIVNHKMWGVGTVMAVDSKTITILFNNLEIGTKKLLKKVAPINKV